MFWDFFERWGQPILKNNMYGAEDQENTSKDKQPALESDVHSAED
jgi:hypothetical protein